MLSRLQDMQENVARNKEKLGMFLSFMKSSNVEALNISRFTRRASTNHKQWPLDELGHRVLLYPTSSISRKTTKSTNIHSITPTSARPGIHNRIPESHHTTPKTNHETQPKWQAVNSNPKHPLPLPLQKTIPSQSKSYHNAQVKTVENAM